MTPPTRDRDVLQTLSRRRGLLAALEAGPRRKRALVEALSSARSTIDRALRDLEVLGFVDRVDGAYRLTAAGRLALSEHRVAATSIEAIEDASDVLAALPPSAPMSVRLLEGATTRVPDPCAPNEPLEEIADLLGAAERYRGLARADRIPQLRRRLYDRTVEGDLDAEAIVTTDLAEVLLEDRPAEITEVVARGDVDLFSVPSLPYGLALVECPDRTVVFVVVHGDTADVATIVRNETPAAVAWAEETYRRFRAEATKLEAPDVPR